MGVELWGLAGGRERKEDTRDTPAPQPAPPLTASSLIVLSPLLPQGVLDVPIYGRIAVMRLLRPTVSDWRERGRECELEE